MEIVWKDTLTFEIWIDGHKRQRVEGVSEEHAQDLMIRFAREYYENGTF